MNFLFLSQVYPDDGAPVLGTFNRALCRALAVDHRVHVLAPRPWLDVLRRRVRREGAFTGVDSAGGEGASVEYPTYWYLPRMLQHRYGRDMFRSVRRALRRVEREFHPDVVLSYWAHPEGGAGLEAAHELGIPAVCIVGGSDVLLLPYRHPLRRREVVRVLTESDAVITVSNGLRRACLELGARPDRVHTIYQGVDPGLFHPRERVAARRRVRVPTGIATFVWVGRMVDVKRVDLLLEAVAMLKRDGLRMKVYLLGDGPLTRAHQELAGQLGVEATVDFVGPVPPDELPDWYSAVDATVLCSRSDGLPNVLRETLACGTPFVATDVGSIREIADESYSILTPTGDATALARAMRSILEARYRAAAGRHRPRTWLDCAGEVAALCERLRRDAAAELASRSLTESVEPVLVSKRPGDQAAARPDLEVVEHFASSRTLVEAPASTEGAVAGEDHTPQPSSDEPFDFMQALNRRLRPQSAPPQRPDEFPLEASR